MPNINEDTKPIARKVLPIIYVIDTSGSMTGEKIASVNEAMHETAEVLKEVSENNPDAEIKIAALQFSSGAKWITNKLEELSDFVWYEVNAGGLTDLGAALKELDINLSRSVLLKSDTGFCVPVIIFMSDGEPTDDYAKELAKIKANNKWFKYATKIAIAVGEEANKTLLAEVVGNIEACITVTDVEILKKLIKVASVTASMINSKSRTSEDQDTAVQIIKDTLKQIDDPSQIDVTETTDDTSKPKPEPKDTTDVSSVDDIDESDW